jgi:hypothetical protein
VTSSPAKPHEDLEKLALVATPGPWRAQRTSKWHRSPGVIIYDAGRHHIATLSDYANAEPVPTNANARLIAAASPARVLSLIGEVRELRRLLEDLTPGGSEFHGDPQRCAECVRERLASVARVQAENRRLREALEEIVKGAPDEEPEWDDGSYNFGDVRDNAYDIARYHDAEIARRALAGESQ